MCTSSYLNVDTNIGDCAQISRKAAPASDAAAANTHTSDPKQKRCRVLGVVRVQRCHCIAITLYRRRLDPHPARQTDNMKRNKWREATRGPRPHCRARPARMTERRAREGGASLAGRGGRARARRGWGREGRAAETRRGGGGVPTCCVDTADPRSAADNQLSAHTRARHQHWRGREKRVRACTYTARTLRSVRVCTGFLLFYFCAESLVRGVHYAKSE